jgi:methionyl-tRNA formyltransferase
MLKVAFFGVGGETSTKPLEAIAKEHQVVIVVESRPRKPLLRRMRTALVRLVRGFDHARSELEQLARRLHVPHRFAVSRADPRITRLLLELQPDILCIAGYHWLLPSAVYTIPRLGAINLHTSLLPRQRGAMPLFWVYHADDRETGVTIHRVSDQADAGDILKQQAFPLERGLPIATLFSRCADVGTSLFLEALESLERGIVTPLVQDEQRATHAPVVQRGTSMVPFQDWDVERVWHVLAGLYPMFREPLMDERGELIRYGGVLGYDRVDHDKPFGSVSTVAQRYELYCRGGIIHLEGQIQSSAVGR